VEIGQIKKQTKKEDVELVQFYIFRKLTWTISILNIPDTTWFVLAQQKSEK
jgi:hypothetical protein